MEQHLIMHQPMFPIHTYNKNKSGFMLLEIIISIAIIVIAFGALIGVAFLVIKTSSSIHTQTQANFMVREEFEAVRNFRDGTTWATNGLGIVNTGDSNPYHVINSSNKWSLASGVETAGIFSKKVVFDKVSRVSGAGDIEPVYNPSHVDNDTVKVTVTVSWAGKTLQAVSYFTNWKDD